MESSIEFSTSPTGASQATRYRIFKIVVIGDSGVGKTCLTYRFCAGKFPDKTEATIGVDFRERILDIEGEKVKVGQLYNLLVFWDLLLRVSFHLGQINWENVDYTRSITLPKLYNMDRPTSAEILSETRYFP